MPRGFTFIELLIVSGLIIIISTLTLPATIHFYKTQQLNDAKEGLVQVLRRAQQKAMSVENDSSFGVYVGSGATGYYSLFRGISYQKKDDEEIFEVQKNIIFGGDISEVVFTKLKGTPTVSGNITLTLDGKEEIININPIGRVNRQ